MNPGIKWIGELLLSSNLWCASTKHQPFSVYAWTQTRTRICTPSALSLAVARSKRYSPDRQPWWDGSRSYRHFRMSQTLIDKSNSSRLYHLPIGMTAVKRKGSAFGKFET
jgi:hypothetical protein